MKAVITGENERLVGVNLLDNNDAEHVIEIEKEGGEITGHQCEAYADDPANRTDEENEHNNQARRFAKYYVYAERGYDTVEHVDNPEYVEAVRQAIASLSNDDFEQFFSPVHQQLRSHHDSTVERPQPLQSAVRYPDDVIYKQNLYLGIDPRKTDVTEDARAIAADRGLDLEEGMASRALTELSASELEKWQAFTDDLADTIDPETVDTKAGLEDGAVSGIHVSYPDEHGELVTDYAKDPLERQPDARLELLTADPGSLEEFKSYLDHHLKCQVRDCLVGMGLTPPEEFRVLGPGKFIYTRRYNYYDMYPELHSSRSNPARLFG